MLKSKITYRTILFALLTAFIMPWNGSYASSDQDMISLAAQSLGAGTGNTAPSTAYNPKTNQYFVVFAKNDGSCAEKRLFGVLIDAITGEPSGAEVPISDCSTSFSETNLMYSGVKNEYFLAYRSIGSGAEIKVQFIDSNNTTPSAAITLSSVFLGDPYGRISIAENHISNTYVLSYHEEIGATDNKIIFKYIDRDSKLLKGHPTTIDSDNSNLINSGVSNCQIISLGESIFACFELKLNSGSEIWGTSVNPSTGLLNVEIFQISPSSSGDTVVVNPSASLNSEKHEILITYERSHLQIATAKLNTKLRGILIDGNSNNVISSEKILSEIPATGETYEDAKNPFVTYSQLCNEFIIEFYGRWWVNSSNNRYHNFIQRIDASELTLIESSSIVSNDIGSVIEQNNSLLPLDISYNNLNNQYLLSWTDQSSDESYFQIWRYDNNPPKNLNLSNKSRNENLAVGTTFGSFSAEDPDPEDSNISYALTSGIGDGDNNYFTVSGDKLKVKISPNYEEKSSLSIRVKATDTNGSSTEKVFALTINDIPEKPQNITLEEPLEITENAINFTSEITVTDEDFGDEHSFKLAAGDSSLNNSNFDFLNDSILILVNPANFEDSSYQYIRIEAEDASGYTYSKGFAIRVLDINEPADTVYVSPGSIAENNPDAFLSVIIDDPDEVSNYTITLTAGEGGEDNKYFTPEDNKLLPNTEFDFEEKKELSLRILIKEGDFTDTAKVVVKIENVNDAPESISLSNNILTEGMDSGYKIGKVTTYDQDADDTHDYDVLVGDDLFFIDEDDSLVSKIPLVYNYQDESKNSYKIAILSTDNQGASKQENFTIQLIPVPDTEKPYFGPYLNNDPFQPELGEMVLSVAATDNEELDTAYFYHRKIRSSEDFVKVSTKLDRGGSKSFTIEATVDETYMDELGMEYYFEIFDAAENAIQTPVKYVYLKPESVLFEPTSKSYDGSAESYRHISNPYELGSNKVSAIFSDYGPSDRENWRLFKYENGDNIEIGTDGSALLESGKAYWFNKSSTLKNAITLEKPEPLEYNRIQEKNIQLKQGWNLVGNPYPFSIDWEDILNFNNNEEVHPEAFKYEKGHKILTTLDQFEGAYVFAENSTSIKIPVLANPSDGRKAKPDDISYEWFVQFNLRNKTSNYNLSAIGMHSAALESFDKYDTPLLPRFVDYSELSFEHPEHQVSALTKDISSIKENHIWEFIASTSSSENSFELSWSQPDFKESDRYLMLYDMRNNIAIDMSLMNSYSINLEKPAAFKAIYGDKAFVDGVLSNINIQALNPYPNPFKSEVYLPVVLPVSNMDYEVTCSIFNLMGDQIFHQEDYGVPHGIYDVIWEDMESFTKGIYIYSIKVRNKFLTREFHGRLVKN